MTKTISIHAPHVGATVCDVLNKEIENETL